MQRATAVRLIEEIHVNFRYTYKDMTQQDMQIMIARWYDCLRGYSDEAVEGAFRTALCRSSMPPTIADIIGIIERQERLKEPSDMALWSELMRQLKDAQRLIYTEYGYKRAYELKSQYSHSVYDALSEPLKAYMDFDSFCELCGFTSEQLQFERARFLKAIPEIRQALRDKRTIEATKPMIAAGQGIQQLTGGK